MAMDGRDGGRRRSVEAASVNVRTGKDFCCCYIVVKVWRIILQWYMVRRLAAVELVRRSFSGRLSRGERLVSMLSMVHSHYIDETRGP